MPRPKFVPTPALREMVRSHAAVGTPQKVIARLLKVRSPKTVRKYFRDELDLGQAEANASVAGELYNNATRGDTKTAAKRAVQDVGRGLSTGMAYKPLIRPASISSRLKRRASAPALQRKNFP